MELTDSLTSLFIATAQSLKGSARRLFMARTVRALGAGGQRRAERALGWSRMTLRKGTHELASGFICLDAFSACGRKPVEAHLPNVLPAIRTMVDSQSQADPQCRTIRLYTRLTAAEVRWQLIAHKGYSDDAFPTVATLTTQLNALGDYPKKVTKSQPPKKSQTPTPSSPKCIRSIRTRMRADDVLRVSMDAKATVRIGPFARGGKTRAQVEAVDHDFPPTAPLTPVGIFLPELEELFVYGVTSKVTSDCLVDRLAQWWEAVRKWFTHITTLVINVDNGPENPSRRTQFMQRLVDCVAQYRVTVRRASYPPYPSKYNPIERCWGILENHWNGTLLDAIDAALQCAATMTWKGTYPLVELVTTIYQTGVTLTKEAMEVVEAQLKRLPHLEKWFVDIVYSPLARDI